jgi:hypothetical protein
MDLSYRGLLQDLKKRDPEVREDLGFGVLEMTKRWGSRL